MASERGTSKDDGEEIWGKSYIIPEDDEGLAFSEEGYGFSCPSDGTCYKLPHPDWNRTNRTNRTIEFTSSAETKEPIESNEDSTTDVEEEQISNRCVSLQSTSPLKAKDGEVFWGKDYIIPEDNEGLAFSEEGYGYSNCPSDGTCLLVYKLPHPDWNRTIEFTSSAETKEPIESNEDATTDVEEEQISNRCVSLQSTSPLKASERGTFKDGEIFWGKDYIIPEDNEGLAEFTSSAETKEPIESKSNEDATTDETKEPIESKSNEDATTDVEEVKCSSSTKEPIESKSSNEDATTDVEEVLLSDPLSGEQDRKDLFDRLSKKIERLAYLTDKDAIQLINLIACAMKVITTMKEKTETVRLAAETVRLAAETVQSYRQEIERISHRKHPV